MNVKLPISYSGNKFKIIDDLYKYFPNDIEILYEVFGGTLTVGTNTDIKKIEYNDIFERNFNRCFKNIEYIY